MLPQKIATFLQKPSVLSSINFIKTHEMIFVGGFLVFSILFCGSIFLFSQQTQVLGMKIVKPTATPKPPKPTATPKPTKTPTLTPTLEPTVIATLTPTPIQSGPTLVQASATPQPAGGDVPAKVLDLSNWKLTLPIGSSESPKEIVQPELANFVLDPWFVVSGGVRFRAAVNAPTTSGFNYPRSELREMKNGGKERAEWSSTSGTHTMTIDEAITALPQKKPHVVAGQIHDADDDVIVIRLEGSNLYVNVDGKNEHTLDAGYTLGKRFSVKFAVSGGVTKIFYNGTEAYTLNKDYSGAYFKAGAYTQSNCSKEDVCSESNYGEVIIYSLSVTHS